MAAKTKFTLAKKYIHIDGAGSALEFAGGKAFWDELMSGKPRTEGVKRCFAGGWLVGVYHFEEDWDVWEMHPQGEEILTAVAGELVLHLEREGKKRKVNLTNGKTFVVPRGTWHTAKVKKSCDMLAMTAGSGTQHRPL
jgi:mannose-6-phosphate isomerase-like protein (cupin superfamily)